jgi:hypothetical protein
VAQSEATAPPPSSAPRLAEAVSGLLGKPPKDGLAVVTTSSKDPVRQRARPQRSGGPAG